MSPKRGYKRSWKNLLLDTNYQLVFTAFMVISAALFMTGLGFVVLKEVRTATQTAVQDVQGKGEGLVDPKVSETTIAHLRAREESITWWLVGIGVALTLGLFGYGIKMTHHVAGPLFKISLYCDKIAKGKFVKIYSLRRGDQLVEFYAHFKQAYGALRRREEEDVAALRAVVSAAERAELAKKSADAAERLRELESCLAAKEASLG